MGKKQTFIAGILLVTAVLLTISLANFTNSYFFDKKEVVSTDSHYVTVRVTPQDGVSQEAYDSSFSEFCEQYAFQGKYTEVFRFNGGALTLKHDGFAQLADTNVSFDDFSYVSAQYVSEDELIYGRMPQNNKEIVVDRWLFDRLLESDGIYSQLFPKLQDFLGSKLVSSVAGDEFEITGICDKGEPSIYMEQNKAMGLGVNAYRIASVEQLQAEFPEEYQDTVLEDGEVMVPESEMVKYKRYKIVTLRNGRTYKIAGSFPDEFGEDYVMTEAACQQVRNDYILELKGYSLYTDNPEQAIRDLKAAAKPYRHIFALTATNRAKDDLEQFEKSRQENVVGRNLIVAAAVLISLFMIYFTIKSNVASRMEELTVYRLIGIAKKSIVQAYLLEMFLVTSYTVLPAVLVTSGIIKFIGSIPSLELGMNYPWGAAVCLIAVIYIFNMLISIIPVQTILSKPPAALAVKD